ncbi:MAG: hypothetical protein A2051_01030 [Desulfovibrionales bacterium GWA2_65_9]|nr:MAG: hypothetical protein A2051_01030 [Desulfovibrionales bacterium GWA2_65_9]
MPRRVLVLYDASGGAGPDDNIVHQGFQMVFDYYGLVPYFRDINSQALPDDAAMADTCAVVTALGQNAVRKPRPYLPWLLRQMKAGRRVMILGHLGVAQTQGADFADVDQLSRAIFVELGAAPASLKGLDQRAFRYGRKAPGLIDFERPLPPQPVVTSFFEQRGPALKVYASLTHPARPGKEFPAVFVGASGGFAAEHHIYWEESTGDNRRKWYLNPFAFVEDSLGLKGRIVPDVTTLNGLRMAFSHVDADGFAGYSRVANGKSMCGEVLRERIYKRFNFPVTLSLIVADVDPKIATEPKRAAKAQELARELFRLPNVEPGSHTYSHPFYWDPGGKTRKLYENRFPYKIPGYTFSEAQEIDGSIRFISALSPADKPCRVLQWSGDCMPTARQIARCDDLGLLNINGGDTMLDQRSNSLANVAPMYRVVGNRIQTFTAMANENVMTNLWTGPFYGYRFMIETIKRTGTPRRLKPIDLYYHFFSGEHEASVKALEDVYSFVLTLPLAPVFTSQYLEAARDYHTVRILRAGPDVYHIENYGRSLTLRLDANASAPNLERSENILGYSRQKEGLFVSLAPGAARAVLSLENAARKSAPLPYLAEATGYVSDFRPGMHSVSLTYKGFGQAGRIRLAGFKPGAQLQASGPALAKPAPVRADAAGFAEIPGLRSGQLEVAAP